MERTTSLASSAESTTAPVIPLRSRAPATAPIFCLGATRENLASASLLGPATEESSGGPVAGGAPTSLTADLSEALVDQRNSHRALPYGCCAALDGATPDIACSEQPGQACFER